MAQQPYKVCPQCQQATTISAAQCGYCGRFFQTTAPASHQTQVFPGGAFKPVVARPSANLPLILTMWFLTLVCIAMSAVQGNLVWLLIDVVAVVCAIVLVCSKSRGDKINGAIKLGLELIAFCIGAYLSYTHSQQMYKLTDPDTPSSISTPSEDRSNLPRGLDSDSDYPSGYRTSGSPGSGG